MCNKDYSLSLFANTKYSFHKSYHAPTSEKQMKWMITHRDSSADRLWKVRERMVKIKLLFIFLQDMES
jgi:hypothetical protein